MQGPDAVKQDVGVKSFCLAKFADDEAVERNEPYEIVSGGDKLPTVITRSGIQVVTYEPEEL